MSIVALPPASGLTMHPGVPLFVLLGTVPPLPPLVALTMHGSGAAGLAAYHDTRVGRLVGTVKERVDANTQAPLARLVRLHCQATGRMVAQTWSSEAGDYAFERVPPGRYMVLSVDHEGQWAGVLESDVWVRVKPAQWAHRYLRHEPNVRYQQVVVYVRDRRPVYNGGGGIGA